MDTMKRRRFPNTYVILSILIVLCALATLVVPPGQYITAADGIVSFESVPRAPQTWQVFSSLYDGFVKQAGIIAFILIASWICLPLQDIHLNYNILFPNYNFISRKTEKTERILPFRRRRGLV